MARVTRTPGPGEQQLRLMLSGLAENKQVKVGYVDSSKYEDGTSVAYVAAIQEFGSPQMSIPPRPTIRPTVDRDEGKWRNTAIAGAKAIANGSQTITGVLDVMGLQAAGGIKKSISQLTSPPLSPTTLRLRKLKRDGVQIGGRVVGEAHAYANSEGADLSGVSTKPLVFDGIMIGAVTSVVEKAP
jgi:hypothetical protein